MNNNFRAGIFVLLSLALGIATFITLQKLSFGATNPYRIRFLVENGVSGLFPGSEVRVGGLKRGRVVSIVPVTEDGRLSRIEADIELEASIALFKNAEVIRVAPILGNTSWLNFNSTGGPSDSDGDGITEPAEPLPPGGTIDAVEAPGMLANIVGARSAERIVTIIERTEQFSTVLSRVPADYRDKIVPALDAASATIVQLKADYERWRVKVDETLDSATAAAQNLEDGTRNAGELVSDARATLAENRPKLLATMTNLESASGTAKEVLETVKTDTLPKVSSLLGEGERAVGEFADLLDRVDGELVARMPDIRSFITDLRVAAGQLKLATIEVRRSPWRLLYRPSTDVLAHEQLYEAARSFASATGDLRSASEGIQDVLTIRPDLFDRDPGLREQLQKSLLDAVSRYEVAQRQLYGILTGEK